MQSGASPSVISRLRNALNGRQRQVVRRVADALLAPIGSINGSQVAGGAVALTFDDGPDPIVTPKLLDLLAAYKARATFFILTERALDQRALVQRMVAEGHEVGLHADRHERLTAVPLPSLRRRLQSARRQLELLTGQPVRWFRPPYGAQTVSTYLAAQSCGLDVVVWGPYAQDWVQRQPEAVAARGLEKLRGGDILLLHDGLELPPGEPAPYFDRVRAFELILDGLQQRGLHSVTVATLTQHGARRTAWFRS